ncbi:MAG: PspC domain-containing protein [Candidatus Omnitrophica bacterium]|nr:PspC domain-containing protein [Candidatus Omnitrophota bacterium]
MKKKFYRIKRDSRIYGVCSGLGNYFSLEPDLVRIFFAVLALLWGAGLWLYLILCWKLAPKDEGGNENSA